MCTQPRRVAATSVATRVAVEYGCALGDEVGYGVRFDFKCSSKTVIKYYTDGVLLRETMSDPLLSKYSVIIVDEAHVRSLSSDILLGLLKKISKKRKDLRIIVTSATLDAEPLKQFFETNDTEDASNDTACILSVQGRQFPVDILYLNVPCRDYVRACVDTVLSINKSEDWGDILVFLPGGEDIDTAVHLLNDEYNGETMYFLPLYSSLPHHVQMAVFEPTPPHKRKVVFATNIAEASITIEGIRFVVDSGFVKLNYFDVRTGLEALVTCPTTKAAATQRAGRAGRTMEGKCFRLMTEDTFENAAIMADHAPAEMQRTDITSAVLQLKALGIDDVLHFDFLSPPPTDSMIFSLELLYSLGALDEKCNLTARGATMAEMPVEPRISNVLLRSHEFGCGEEMLTIAAMCSVEYPFITVRARGSLEAKQKVEKDVEEFAVPTSDHLTLLNIFRQYEESGFSSSWCDSLSLQPRILARAREIRKNLHSVLVRCSEKGAVISSCGDDDTAVRRCLVAGYFSHAAKLGHDGMYHTLRGGGVTVMPHPTSVVAKFGAPPEWVIYNEVHLSRTTQLREITKIDPRWLTELAPHYYTVKF